MSHFPSRLIIDGEALAANWRRLARESGSAECGAAVKADGYGLGASETVRRLAEAGCRHFYVATWAEADELMPWPSELQMSVLHGVGPDDMAAALDSPARPVLNTAAQIERWFEHGQGRPCDLMVDTGMNRLGTSPEEARQAVAAGLHVETLMSHLACADEPGHPLNEEQLRIFEQLRRAVEAQCYSLANSAGIFLGERYAFDLTRPGISLYGGVPVPDDPRQLDAISQVASIEAQIIQLREVPAGGSVGYGATWRAPSARTVAIINLGYADGYVRSLGEAGQIISDGRTFPFIGRVSMDLIAVDLNGGPRFAEGDWLTVDYSLPRLALASGKSQYEMITGLGHRFERRWV